MAGYFSLDPAFAVSWTGTKKLEGNFTDSVHWERTLLIAHQDPPLGVPLDEAATASPQRDIPSKSAPLQKTALQAESAFGPNSDMRSF